MNKRQVIRSAVAAGLLLSGMGAQGQSSDALLNKLVEKGILTVQESKELKQETDKNVASAVHNNMGLPDWVKALKLSGDFRGRVDYMGSDNSAMVDRWRLRYRLRAGVTLSLKDDFEVGFRLASSDAGGNPLSNNTTFENDATKKPVWIDTAYATWTPIHDGEWTLSGTIGKMVNPFVFQSYMEFDPDYTPEGAALQAAYKINDAHALKFNGGAFVLDELAASGRDPFLFGGQILWDAKWTKQIESSLGVSGFSVVNTGNLTTANVPDNNTGNTRSAAGNLVYNYNPIIASGSLTYKLDKFPLYKGTFPIKLGGEYLNNPAAPSSNTGWWAGVTFGKAAHKGQWDLAYRYQRLEGDAWYEELVDDDNAAYFQAAFTGGKSGMVGGTDIQGHLVKLNYAITDSLTFTFTGYFNELIHPNPAGSKSGGIHVMADVMWKF
jgi:hypothetical protein